MFSKKEIKTLSQIENSWLNFVNARNKKAFELDVAPHWLTMLDREKMIEDLLSIFKTHRRKKVAYE